METVFKKGRTGLPVEMIEWVNAVIVSVHDHNKITTITTTIMTLNEQPSLRIT